MDQQCVQEMEIKHRQNATAQDLNKRSEFQKTKNKTTIEM